VSAPRLVALSFHRSFGGALFARRTVVAATVLLSLVRPAPAFAQVDDPGPAPKFRLRIGPLTVDPSINLTNIGYDNNVFDAPTTVEPKGDFTFTVTPAAKLRVPIFRSVVTARVTEDLIWYQTYATERAANNAVTLGWRMPFNHVSFTVNAHRLSVKDRPGFEITDRVQRTENGYDALVEYRIMPKTFLGVTAQRASTDYGDNPVINGVDYAHEFTRVTSGGGATLRYQLTPITSVSLVATRTEDRFEFSTLRDSNSTVASAVIAFDPLGILSGSATIGYTFFSTLTADVPRFEGVTGSVNASYRLLGNMQIGVTAVRSVEYSYDINEPYYLQTGFGGSLTRSVIGPLDAMVRGGLYHLAYHDREGIVLAVPNRDDSVYSYGLGAGYHLGKGVRLGFNIDESRRDSAVPSARYAGLRFGSSVTYAF
jgi:Putative beta-barrel porin 2